MESNRKSKHFSHLTLSNRFKIKDLLNDGKNRSSIAKIINVNPCTITREIKRNAATKGYFPVHANKQARERIKNKYEPTKMNSKNIKIIIDKINIEWSPDQISGWMAKSKGISISRTSIYNFINREKKEGGVLFQHLRFGKKR